MNTKKGSLAAPEVLLASANLTESFAWGVTLSFKARNDLIDVVEILQVVFFVRELVLIGIELIVKEIATGKRFCRLRLCLNVVVQTVTKDYRTGSVPENS
jgi:hypothetical protein